MRKQVEDLPVTKFEVHAVYGAHLCHPALAAFTWKMAARHAQGAPALREGWRPIYLNNLRCRCLPVHIGHDGDTLTVQPPPAWDASAKRACDDFGMRFSHLITIREDGMAAITIRLRALRRDGKCYGLPELLAALLLAPRTVSGIRLSTEASRGEKETASIIAASSPGGDASEGSGLMQQLDSVTNKPFSPLYRLFLLGLRGLLSSFSEVARAEQLAGSTLIDALSESDQSVPSHGDPQLPYFVVMIDVPKKFYRTHFLEGIQNAAAKRRRRVLTQQLGGILGRWLTPTNVPYVSTEYLTALGLLENGAFVNKYMNSLSFVTYSATATLCVHPDIDDKDSCIPTPSLQPQEATYGSILRCVELSRLRWHHAKTLSDKLDALISEVVTQQDGLQFSSHLQRLIELRSQAALYFLDPLVHFWDATVGGEVAAFLQAGIIDRLEKESARKLEMVKQLIQDRLNVLDAHSIESLATTPATQTKPNEH